MNKWEQIRALRDQVFGPGSLSRLAPDDKPGSLNGKDKYETVTPDIGKMFPTPKTLDRMTGPELGELLLGTSPKTALAALEYLEPLQPKDPEIHLKIATCLDTGYGDVAERAADLLRKLKPTDPRVFEQLEGYTKREGDDYLPGRAQKLLEDLRKKPD